VISEMEKPICGAKCRSDSVAFGGLSGHCAAIASLSLLTHSDTLMTRIEQLNLHP
jgi:hypothetical protein